MFAHYSDLWWSRTLEDANKSREITSGYISAREHDLSFADVRKCHLTKYQAAHEQLAKMIEQDPVAQEVWYDNGRIWHPIGSRWYFAGDESEYAKLIQRRFGGGSFGRRGRLSMDSDSVQLSLTEDFDNVQH